MWDAEVGMEIRVGRLRVMLRVDDYMGQLEHDPFINRFELRVCVGDDWMNDFLITYIEKDVFNNINNEKIIQHFYNMSPCHG